MEWEHLRDFLNNLTPEQNCRVDKLTGRHWPVHNIRSGPVDKEHRELYNFIYNVAKSVKSSSI